MAVAISSAETSRPGWAGMGCVLSRNTGLPQGNSPRAAGVPEAIADAVYQRVREKLSREPVEDFRIDFEDGCGSRPDDEEDRHVAEAAGRCRPGWQREISRCSAASG
jgi:hypothetical protein